MRKIVSITATFLLLGNVVLGALKDINERVHPEGPPRNTIISQRTFSNIQWEEPYNENEVANSAQALFNAFLVPPVDDSLKNEHSKAIALMEQVKTENRFLSTLDSAALITLPVGIVNENSPADYAIIIDKVTFKPDVAYLSAYMCFTIPGTDKKITFKGNDIPFTMEGGISGEAKLELLVAEPFKFGESMAVGISGDGETYVEWDCEGFKEMGLGLDIQFNPSFIVPEDPATGKILKQQNVTTHVAVKLANWNDLVAQIDLPAFQVSRLKGVGFSIKQAILDFSDIRNPAGVVFPANYLSTYKPEDAPELWRGVYIGETEIRMPAQFEKKGTKNRVSFTASRLIFDDIGFSGTLIAEQILTLKEGEIGSWAFSLEKLGVTLQANQLQKAGFEGKILVPTMKEPLTYTACIDQGQDYLFTIGTEGMHSFDLWAAKVELQKSSFIEIRTHKQKFYPRACLDGEMDINVADKGVSLANISFEQLEIKTTGNPIQVKSFGFGSEFAQQKMGNFPISINNVQLKTLAKDKVGLGFDLTLNLIGEKEGGFAAGSSLMVIGKAEDQKLKNWKYDRLKVSRIAVDIRHSAYSVKGSLTFYEKDSIYGNGFNGQVAINVIGLVSIEGTAIFGTVDNYRYWYADAMAMLKAGPTIGPIQLNSFGGGLFHHMRQLDLGEELISNLGRTVSGIKYRPDRTVLMGIKASVGLNLSGSPSTFNGDATLEIVFNHGGGLRTIDFRGNANFMSGALTKNVEVLQEQVGSMSQGEDPKRNKAQGMSANLHIRMDFPNKTFHSNLKVFVNVAGGVLKGVGPGNLAGESVMHFSPDEWYIHVGRPDQPVGLELLSAVKATSYFMVGDNIPGSPPPPDVVSEILNDIDLDYMKEENALGSGRGIAFGARFEMDTGEQTFLIFYARFQAGLGFDIMLKDYQDIRCKGRSGKLGINGWYANGQAYGYFAGDIGVKFKLFGKKKKKEILSFGAAIVLQAKLPNPIWLRGIVGGQYSILGGMIKGDCQFELTIGEECEFVGEGSVLEGFEVISQVTPVAGSADVDVFTAPQAIFNMEVGKVFEMVDLDETKKAFRIKFEDFVVMHEGQKLEGQVEWNEDHTVLVFRPDDIMPSQKQLEAFVSISYQEQKHNIWKAVKVNGEVLKASKGVTFTTGKAPGYIPEHNVAYTYPINEQLNFYPKEYSQAYIKLAQGQDYLFSDPNWTIEGRYVTKEGVCKTVGIQYVNNEILSVIPEDLALHQVYQFQVVRVPKVKGIVDQNVSQSEVELDVSDDAIGNKVTFTTNKAESSIENTEDKVIYQLAFRSSQYSTLGHKLGAIVTYPWRVLVTRELHMMGLNLSGELFDTFELEGTAEIKPVVRMKAILKDQYYLNRIYPLIYEPLQSEQILHIDWREHDKGIPPVYALHFLQQSENLKLDDTQISAGAAIMPNQLGTINYNLEYYYGNDFWNLQNQAAYQLSLKRNMEKDMRWYRILTETYFPVSGKGTYYFQIQYVIPGRNKVVNSYPMQFENIY